MYRDGDKRFVFTQHYKSSLGCISVMLQILFVNEATSSPCGIQFAALTSTQARPKALQNDRGAEFSDVHTLVRYPEVKDRIINLKFPGRGQRNTRRRWR